MNSIENYKKRFNMLMESTIGDVKPLITEDQSKLQPVQQQVNLAVQEMNKAINDYTKQNQLTTQLPNIKISKSQESVPVKAADGSQTNVNIDSYGFDLNGKQPKTGINFSRATDPTQYKNFQIEWTSSLSDVNWLMNVGTGNVGRNLANPLKAISDKYLNVAMGLLNQKPTQPK
jgi:hypothetical protein